MEFIPVAEHAGVIDTITLWLIDEVLGHIRTHSDYAQRLSIAISVSANMLRGPAGRHLLGYGDI